MIKKKIIIVTGGAGFVGANLISLLLDKTSYNIISIDNYSSGSKKNHIKSLKVRYIKGDTSNIKKILKKNKKKFIQFFILVNLQEFFKALINLMNVIILILLDQKLFLNFV